MKTRFGTIDTVAILHDLRKLVDYRVVNVYDISSKAYLIKLAKPDAKAFVFFESGICIYVTEYEWPKNIIPSSFAMKLRKHVRQKRLESVTQLGVDRAIDMQFGSGTFAAHVILELYDRGNIILTDHEYVILNVLRPRTDADNDVKFVVREKFPLRTFRQAGKPLEEHEIHRLLKEAKPNDALRRVFVSQVIYGPALLEHCCRQLGFSSSWNVKKYLEMFRDENRLFVAIQNAHQTFLNIRDVPSQGYIVFDETRNAANESVRSYLEYHPYLFDQHKDLNRLMTFDTFTAAVDEFYSKLETQKLEMKALQQEKAALQKLNNIRSDHQRRLAILQSAQQVNMLKGMIIEANCKLIDSAITIMRMALADKLSWDEISDQIEEAAELDDPVATRIVRLNLKESQFVMVFDRSGVLGQDDDNNAEPVQVEIDVNLNAHQNACRFYQQKKSSALKESKTLEASEKALKHAELTTKQTLHDVAIRTNILKARRALWFEKFLWFISSDSYLVIGGRDAQQNEILVKRYLREGDVYVHADVRGATSVIVKNRGAAADLIPPKTLNEAGMMAVCFSVAWDAKLLSTAWWVHSDQVSKTAPAGEYLTTGSFMIRGKKNYLSPSQLLVGFGILFRLDEDSALRHLEKMKETRVANSEESLAVDDESLATHETGDVVSEEEYDESVQSRTAESEFEDMAISLSYLSTEPSEFIVGKSVKISSDTKSAPAGGKPGPKQADNAASSATAKEHKSPKKAKAQKGKLKKKNAKYRNQDEDERALRMRLLRPFGDCMAETDVRLRQLVPVSGDGDTETTGVQVSDECSTVVSETHHEERRQSDSFQAEEALNPAVDSEQAEAEYETNVLSADQVVSDLSTLVGDPAEDDVVLFAMPVCGPYSAMSSYRFKVKMTPGSVKKGKATKTALNLFLLDRSCPQRLKDLMKAIHPEDLSRNIPGKVKIYAPQLTQLKKKPNSKAQF